jgi:hypothetical protein
MVTFLDKSVKKWYGVPPNNAAANSPFFLSRLDTSSHERRNGVAPWWRYYLPSTMKKQCPVVGYVLFPR